MSNHLGETNKMVETPRTDVLLIAHDMAPTHISLISHARELERELNAANERIKRLEEDSDRLHWLLKRGLAWRGCYNGHWLEGEWLYSSQYAIETIDKAKEDKL